MTSYMPDFQDQYVIMMHWHVQNKPDQETLQHMHIYDIILNGMDIRGK